MNCSQSVFEIIDEIFLMTTAIDETDDFFNWFILYIGDIAMIEIFVGSFKDIALRQQILLHNQLTFVNKPKCSFPGSNSVVKFSNFKGASNF